MMKRILSFLLTAVLAAALLAGPASAAEAAPWVETNGVGTSQLTVSIRGLTGSYDSVQVTLTLDEAPSGFTFDELLRDSKVAHSKCIFDGNSVTLYATSQNQINQGESILLGTLTGPTGFQVSSASDLKLVDLDPVKAGNVSYSQIEVGRTDDTGSTGGNGGTSGSGSTGSYDNTGGTGSTGGSTGTGITDNGPGTIPFADVSKADWFYDAVAYVYEAGLMNGTSTSTFGPQGTTTRGMIVTILYRYEGASAAGTSTFLDVPAGQYYTDAVAWAAAHGVVNGYSSTQFGPNDSITREQMAAILYRYAQYKGFDVSGRADLSGYTDAWQISSYARDAMSWANQTGLIDGVDAHTLQPGGSATRAQVATILMRFCENIAK